MVYDPFCGTGSIAIAMTHFKTQTVGSDLDMRVLKGYGVGRKTRNKIDGLDKIDKRNRAPASSIKSMALSGRKRS